MPQVGNYWGELIKTLRLEQKLSQRGLAEGADVNRQTLRRIEEGASDNELETIEKLLEFLGYELDAYAVVSKEEMLRRREQESSDPNYKSKVAAARLLKL